MIATFSAMAQWTVFSGAGASEIACGSATKFAIVNTSTIYYYNFSTGTYTAVTGPAQFDGVGYSADGTLIAKNGVNWNPTSNLLRFTNDPPVLNAFNVINGVLANNVCVLSTSFVIGSTGGNANDNVYRWNGVAWSQLPGSASVAAKKVVVGGTSADIYAMDYSTTGNNVLVYNSGTWSAISNSTLNVTDISVGDATKVLAISGGKLYYRSGGAWVLEASAPTNLIKVSAASDGTIMLLTSSGVIYRNTWANLFPKVVAEYNFNNTYNNVLGSYPFTPNSGTSFVADRNGNPNSALNIFNTGSSVTILGLPYGNSPRTISMWVKMNVVGSQYNMLYSYGKPSTSNSQGGNIRSDGVDYYGYYDNLLSTTSVTNVSATWYFITYTYDGTTAKTYRNGTEVCTAAKTWNTLNNADLFKLGIGVGEEVMFNGAMDDLKIINRAFTSTQVDSMYNFNATVTGVMDVANLNSEFRVFPNPARAFFQVKNSAVGSTLKIMDVTGKLVFTKVLIERNETIETVNFEKGIYIVQLENSGAIACKKLIISK